MAKERFAPTAPLSPEAMNRTMRPAEIHTRFGEVQCPRCKAAMQLVRHIDLKGLPDIYIFYCSNCQHIETVKDERAA